MITKPLLPYETADDNIDAFGTTIRYTGNNSKEKNSRSNIKATRTHDLRNAGGASTNASVRLDKVNGKITVSAPSYVLEREGFKDEIEQTLKTLSRYYRTDKDYKVPLNDGTTKTVQEIIDQLNDATNDNSIQRYVENVSSMRRQEYGDPESGYAGDRKNYGIGDNITLNDRYFTLRNAIALGSDVKDDTRQAISDLPEFEFMRKLNSYDEETGTASLKDIMENAWNREKYSDDELKAANDALKRYFAQGHYDNTDELARNIAMYEFINGRNPDVNWLRNVVETTGSFFEGAWNYIVDVGGYIYLGTTAKIFDTTDKITGELYNNMLGITGRHWEPSKMYVLGYGEMTPQELADKALGYWDEHQQERAEDRDLLSDTAAAAVSMGYGIVKLATLISAGNAMSEGFKLGLANLEASASIGAQAAAEGAVLSTNMFKNGMASIISLMSPQQAATLANVVSFIVKAAPVTSIVGLIGETFGESITGNPKMFYEVLNSDKLSDEARQELWSNFVGNALGMAVGVTVSKGLIKAGQTVKGQAISHNISKQLYKIQTKLHNIANKARFKLHGVADAENYVAELLKKSKINKADAYSAEEMLMTAKKAVANSDSIKIAGKTKQEILEQLDDVHADVDNMLKLENAVDEMRRHGRGIMSEWYLSDEWKAFQGASKNFDDAYDALYKAEKAMGDAAGLRKVGKLAISQDTTNYIQGVNRIAIIDSMTDAAKKQGIKLQNAAAMAKEREALQEAIDAYIAKVSPEVKVAADAVIDAERKWTVQANNLLLKEGLLTEADILEKRASGLWGENGELYVPLMREKHLEAIHQQKVDFFADGTIRKAHNYSFGADDDFLDPLAMSRLYMSQYADKMARQNTVKAYLNVNGATNNEILNVAQTRAARIASSGKMTASRAEVDAVVKDFAKDVRASGVVQEMVDQATATDDLSKAVRNSNTADDSLAKEIAKPLNEYKATRQNTKAGVLSMSNDDVDAFWNEKTGGMSVGDYVVENYDSLPRSTKAKLKEQRDIYKFARGESISADEDVLKEFATGRMAQTLKRETGYNTLDDWFDSDDFAKTTNSQRKKILQQVYGKERADEILNTAGDIHKGNLEEGYKVSNENRIKTYQNNKARARQKLEESIQKRREKYEPFTKGRRKIYELTDKYGTQYYPHTNKRMLELNEIASKRDPRAKMFGSNAKIDAEDIDLALEVRDVKRLRRFKKQLEKATEAKDVEALQKLGDLSDQDIMLLAKWDGKTLPRFSEGTKNLIRRLDKLENMPDLPKDLKVVTGTGKATGEELKAAIASVEYGSETSLLGDIEENMMQGYLSEKQITRELFDEMSDFNPDFAENIRRDIISGSPDFYETDEIQDVAKQYAHDTAIGRKLERAQARSAGLAEVSEKTAGLEAKVEDIVDSKADEILAKMASRPATNATYKELALYYGLDEETASKYFTLRNICDETHKKFFSKNMFNQFKNELRQLKIDDPGDVLARKFTKEFSAKFESEYNDMRVLLQDTAPELVDQREIYAEVRQLASKVRELDLNKEKYVAIQDAVGEISYVETDPLVAHLVSYTYLPKEMTKIQKGNYLMSKMFRLGTTGIRITSMVNQTFRDFGNAFVGGNMYRTWSKCVGEMRDVLGDGVVDWIEASDKHFADAIRQAAKETGEDANELAYEAIKRYGAAISPEATETAVYKHAGDVSTSIRAGKARGVSGISEKGMKKTLDGINRLEDLLGKPNEFREAGLRNAVFRNGFADAVKRGYSFQDAKTWATFAMNNATTNFGRATKMFSDLQDSVPFLGAAINGTKSFYRLLSVDPVGVMGRLVGGIIMPVMGLTAYSLKDETNREKWKNLAEYQKDDNLVFIVDGQVLSVPLPQELSAVINPFRQVVEGMFDSNRHSFWELAINDVVGFSPIDLDGFTNIDAYTLSDGTSEDNFLISNIAPGLAKLFSQLAPVPIKAMTMWVTGIDPYTMKKIDRSYKQMDPDTGEAVVMGDYAGELGKFVAWLLKDTPMSMSATMAEKLLGSIFGKAPIDYTGWLIEIGQGVTSWDAEKFGQSIDSVGQQLFESVTSPLYIEQYRTAADADWRNFVSQMYTRKETLLNSDEWQDYMRQYREAKDPETIEKLKTMRKNLLDTYYNDLKTAADNLIKNYGQETFTAEKYAALISLSVMDQTGVDSSTYGKEMLNEVYSDARRQAVHTMYELGFTSPTDYSAFGYVTTNSAGETYVAMSTPMALLDVRNTVSGADELHYANLKSLIETNGLSTSSEAYRAMSDSVNKIYNKKKLTNSDYKKINQIYKDWDAKVMRVIYPYIAQYGPDAALNSSRVTDLLDDVVKVPSDYEVNKKGYHFSAPRMNKQRGFAQSYIKYLYERMSGGK